MSDISDTNPQADGSTEGLSFDLTVELTLPVKIKQKDGTTKCYTLHECTASDAVRWRDWMIKQTKIDKRGRPKEIAGIADGENLLIALCLVDDETGQHEDIRTIRKWPSRVTKPLHRWIMENSDLDEDAEDKKELAKNELEPIMAGS